MHTSIDDFKIILQNFPLLTSEGLIDPYALKNNTPVVYEEIIHNIEQERRLFESKFIEFNLCCYWLSKFKHVKNPQISSIYLKYVIQILANEYVCNGSVIAAALHLKLATKHTRHYNQNFYIGISKKCNFIKITRNLADLITQHH